jgi:folate-dependent phosphoribosylglycinamide formyltransferase PurN
MSEKKLKVIVLTFGGANGLLERLSALANVEVAGVFIESVTEPKRTFKEKIKRSIRYSGYAATLKNVLSKFVGRKTTGAEELKAAQDEQNNVEKFAKELKIPIHRVQNYHSEETIDLLKKTGADLGILYGTNIIKESVFSIPKLGSINLHQGLAPLYRGGPTVFWELFNGEKEIGITIHFVATKVDTGDIILQKTFPLEYDFSRYGLDYESFLRDFRAALKEPSVQMMTEAVKLISVGENQRMKQDPSLGKRYRLPTKKEKDALLQVLKKRQRQLK